MSVGLPPSGERTIRVRPSPVRYRVEISAPEVIQRYDISAEQLEMIEMAVGDRWAEGAWGCLGAGIGLALAAADRLRGAYSDFAFSAVTVFDGVVTIIAVSFLVAALVLGLTAFKQRTRAKDVITRIRSNQMPIKHLTNRGVIGS